MKFKKILTLILSSTLIASFSLSLTKKEQKLYAESPKEVLKVYNWADYIYDGSDPLFDDDEKEIPGIIEQFEAYYAEKYPGRTVSVEYDTFDTNEVMLNEIKTGKTQYDLICPSDYIIQRLMVEDMLEEIDLTKIPNYTQYASKYLQNLFIKNEWDKYACGYMWGTVGLTYNPSTVDEEDMKTWTSLWSVDYNKKILIKDSLRETYMVGVMKVYRGELNKARAKYQAGELSAAEYNAILTEIFNRHDKDTLEKVQKTLTNLKKNIYGFEVDSGKNDIVTGKVDINLAWSGDAVFSMDTAEEEDGVLLNYSVPEEGSNIWFDGWCLPKGAKKELAYEFLNFISQPSIACLNMSYIGYTSFIAGDEVLDMVWDWYGDEEGEYTADLTYFFENTLSETYDADRMLVKTDTVGRQFTAQYPTLDIINNCAIMEDFGEGNENVVAMWEAIRANEVSIWLIIVVCGVVVLGAAGYAYYKYSKTRNRRRRRKASLKRS